MLCLISQCSLVKEKHKWKFAGNTKTMLVKLVKDITIASAPFDTCVVVPRKVYKGFKWEKKWRRLNLNSRILCALWPTTNLHKYHGNSTNNNNNNQIGGNNNWHNKLLTMQHVVVVVVVWHVVNYVRYFDQLSNKFQSNNHNFIGRFAEPVSCQVYYSIVFILENPTNNSTPHATFNAIF